MIKLSNLLYSYGNQNQLVMSESLTPDDDFRATPAELAEALEKFCPAGPMRENDDSLFAVVRGGDRYGTAYPIFADAIPERPYVGVLSYSPSRAPLCNHSYNGSKVYIFDQDMKRQVIKVIYDSRTDSWEVSGNLMIDRQKIAPLSALLHRIDLCFPGDIYD